MVLALNHVRVPAGLSLLLLLVYFPLIFRIAPEDYAATTGQSLDPYLGRWLLISGGLFLISAVVYALRLRRGAPEPAASLTEERAGDEAPGRVPWFWRAWTAFWVAGATLAILWVAVDARRGPAQQRSLTRHAPAQALASQGGGPCVPSPYGRPDDRFRGARTWRRKRRARGAGPAPGPGGLRHRRPLRGGARRRGTIARLRHRPKQRCAVRYPDPCWQDPLTEAYGRELAGAVRALAPAPETRAAADGTPVVGVDYRRCRQVSCAVPGPDAAHLTTSGRRTTAFTSVRGDEIDYWIYRPTLGWELIVRRVDPGAIAELGRTPLLESADPVLVPLETLLGRDDADLPSRRGAAVAGTGGEPLGPVDNSGEILRFASGLAGRGPHRGGTLGALLRHHRASWCSITPMPLGQLDSVERPREGAEGLAVGVLDEEPVLGLRPLRLRLELEAVAAGEGDRLEAAEADRAPARGVPPRPRPRSPARFAPAGR